jgi:hypothetical protein
LSFIDEALPPFRVALSAIDCHGRGFSGAHNSPRLVVRSGSNGERLLMEVPLLGISTVSGLDDKVSSNQIEISLLA